MPTYEFLNLSPVEFENLCRDLLQMSLQIRFESFKEGKDGGIDLRAFTSQSRDIIVQCKRYARYKDLISALKTESIKVESFPNYRYILAVSLPLSPQQKDSIATIFKGRLIVQDIYSGNDLNNLLGMYPDIESQHYKLWLSSTNVLHSILHNRIKLQSDIEKSKFDRINKIFVQNDSFFDAIEILNEHRFVIISGNPGTGKSTLARAISYRYLNEGYDQLIAISGGIGEAFDLYHEGKKQVFLFDDFLGTNFLENKLSTNEDRRLVDFMLTVKHAKNKILIITTREYILNQASYRYESLKYRDISMAKCIVDVSKYTKYIKGHILYNHLFFSEVPVGLLIFFVEHKVYQKVIEHPNYNPRIIEAILQGREWKKVTAEKFVSEFIFNLDNPFSVWQTAYENDISELSKILLLILCSLPPLQFKADVHKAIIELKKKRSDKYSFSVSDFDIDRSIMELINTFIRTETDSSGKIVLEFQNPSVKDFLITYLEKRLELQKDIIVSAIFIEQLFYVFTDTHEFELRSGGYFRRFKIPISDEIRDHICKRIVQDFEDLGFSKIQRMTFLSDRIEWRKLKYSDYTKIKYIIDELYHENEEILELVVDKFKEVLLPSVLPYWETDAYMSVLKSLKGCIKHDEVEVMQAFCNAINDRDDLNAFKLFESLFPNSYPDFIRSNQVFRNRVVSFIEEIMNEDWRFEDRIFELEEISFSFFIDTTNQVEKIKAEQDNYENETDNDGRYEEGRAIRNMYNLSRNEDGRIADLFESLI